MGKGKVKVSKMKMYREKGLRYADYVLDYITYELADVNNLHVFVEAFYNCREQGYTLNFHNDDYSKKLQIWVYGQRHSDEPTITYDTDSYASPLFSNEGWTNRTQSFEYVEEAATRAVAIIKEYFEIKE